MMLCSLTGNRTNARIRMNINILRSTKIQGSRFCHSMTVYQYTILQIYINFIEKSHQKIENLLPEIKNISFPFNLKFGY